MGLDLLWVLVVVVVLMYLKLWCLIYRNPDVYFKLLLQSPAYLKLWCIELCCLNSDRCGHCSSLVFVFVFAFAFVFIFLFVFVYVFIFLVVFVILMVVTTELALPKSGNRRNKKLQSSFRAMKE